MSEQVATCVAEEPKMVMNDGSRFTFSTSAFSGHSEFYSSNKALTPPVVKYAGVQKFCQRLLVCALISAKGVSKNHIIDCVMVGQDVHLDIIKKNLKKFNKENHQSTFSKDESVRAWMDSKERSFFSKKI